MSDQAAIDEQVRELVAARREQLAELVHHAVRQELERLVDVELEQRTNGNGAATTSEAIDSTVVESIPTKVCRGCGRQLELAAYEPRRHLCRRCRRDQLTRAREQRRTTAPAPAGGEPPRPGPAADTDG